jgi:hypothetical protein
MTINRGYIHPETKRVAVTVAEYAKSEMNGNDSGFVYSQEAEREGVECWRMIDGIDPHTKDNKFDLWFENGSIPRVVKPEDIVFVQNNHYEKYFLPMQSVKFDPADTQRIVLKYPTFPKETYLYHDREDMYVALDDHSGGYPYRVTALRAHNFKTIEDARKYANVMHEGFLIVLLTTSFSETLIP